MNPYSASPPPPKPIIVPPKPNMPPGPGSCRLLQFSAALTLAFVIGCASMTAYKSLSATQITVQTAMSSFDDLVIKGHVSTNSVPQVSHAYNAFESAFSAAVIAAQFNTNAPSPGNIAILAQNVTDAIEQAKLAK